MNTVSQPEQLSPGQQPTQPPPHQQPSQQPPPPPGYQQSGQPPPPPPGYNPGLQQASQANFMQNIRATGIAAENLPQTEVRNFQK